MVVSVICGAAGPVTCQARQWPQRGPLSRARRSPAPSGQAGRWEAGRAPRPPSPPPPPRAPRGQGQWWPSFLPAATRPARRVPPLSPTCGGSRGHRPKATFPCHPGGSCHIRHRGPTPGPRPRAALGPSLKQGEQPGGVGRARGLRGDGAQREPQGRDRTGRDPGKRRRARGTIRAGDGERPGQ